MPGYWNQYQQSPSWSIPSFNSGVSSGIVEMLRNRKTDKEQIIAALQKAAPELYKAYQSYQADKVAKDLTAAEAEGREVTPEYFKGMRPAAGRELYQDYERDRLTKEYKRAQIERTLREPNEREDIVDTPYGRMPASKWANFNEKAAVADPQNKLNEEALKKFGATPDELFSAAESGSIKVLDPYESEEEGAKVSTPFEKQTVQVTMPDGRIVTAKRSELSPYLNRSVALSPGESIYKEKASATTKVDDTKDEFIKGKRYRDKNGIERTYLGNGEWQ